MSTSTPVYLTTPIYYASGQPHLGHAYTTILVDCFSKYHACKGTAVRLCTGMDEHGLKIQRVAETQKIDPQQLVDQIAEQFKQVWDQFDIGYHDFIRTTEPRHIQNAQSFWQQMQEKGDIYLGHYEGLYCVDCEEYYQESELTDHTHCPIHNKEIEKIKEPSYFFKLSAYQDPLIEHIKTHPSFIQPQARRNEVLRFLEQNKLRDLSISRSSFKWGVPVPNDPEHVMYVWVDALVNYISSLDGPDSETFAKFWGNTVHFIGKDILRFHAIYWPAMLLSAGHPLPQSLVVHGWWTVHDKKISKSEPATKIDPTQFIPDITSDGIRFYLLKGLNLGRDGNLSFEHVINEVNVHLINNIANLLNRLTHMGRQYFDGKIPACPEPQREDSLALIQTCEATPKKIDTAMAQFNPSEAIESLLQLGSAINSYIEHAAPWKLAKEEGQEAPLQEIFAVASESLSWLARLGSPFFPLLAQKIKQQLSITEEEWPKHFKAQARTVHKGEVFLKRISASEEDLLVKKWSAR